MGLLGRGDYGRDLGRNARLWRTWGILIMLNNLFIAIRFDGATDAIIFRDAEQARIFMDLHPEYEDLLESGVYDTAQEALEIWGG